MYRVNLSQFHCCLHEHYRFERTQCFKSKLPWRWTNSDDSRALSRMPYRFVFAVNILFIFYFVLVLRNIVQANTFYFL